MNSIEAHEALTDEEFADRFQRCDLEDIPFTHMAHLRLAWIYSIRCSEQIAINRISEQLKAYTKFVGAEDKYNHTVTIAAMKAVQHFVHRSSSSCFSDFIKEFPQLTSDFKQLLQSHYSIDIFSAPQAKAVFLEPDLAPFD